MASLIVQSVLLLLAPAVIAQLKLMRVPSATSLNEASRFIGGGNEMGQPSAQMLGRPAQMLGRPAQYLGANDGGFGVSNGFQNTVNGYSYSPNYFNEPSAQVPSASASNYFVTDAACGSTRSVVTTIIYGAKYVTEKACHNLPFEPGCERDTSNRRRIELLQPNPSAFLRVFGNVERKGYNIIATVCKAKESNSCPGKVFALNNPVSNFNNYPNQPVYNPPVYNQPVYNQPVYNPPVNPSGRVQAVMGYNPTGDTRLTWMQQNRFNPGLADQWNALERQFGKRRRRRR